MQEVPQASHIQIGTKISKYTNETDRPVDNTENKHQDKQQDITYQAPTEDDPIVFSSTDVEEEHIKTPSENYQAPANYIKSKYNIIDLFWISNTKDKQKLPEIKKKKLQHIHCLLVLGYSRF